MSLVTGVAVAHWCLGAFNPALFALSLVLALAVSQMHHNHKHRPIWRTGTLNRATDAWFTVSQGHPGFVFEILHIDNHHRFNNGADDITRTNRFGDRNDLCGLLVHPLHFAAAALPHVVYRIREVRLHAQREFLAILAHYALLAGVDGVALWLDWRAACYVVIAPQLAAMFWLLASNYLQHAHTDGGSDFDHSRNFLGPINQLCFNVGYHTAHHHAPDAHWSELPAVHAALAPRIAPHLNEPGFARYLVRTFLLRSPRARSRASAPTSNSHGTAP